MKSTFMAAIVAIIGLCGAAQAQPIDIGRVIAQFGGAVQGRGYEGHAREARRDYGEQRRHGGGRDVYDGDRIRIIDGDTVALPCDIPGPGCSEKIRIQSIDAPESIEPKCERELKAGLEAKARLSSLIRGSRVRIERTGIDPYGRTLANIHVVEGEVGEILLRERFVLPYRPGREAKGSRIAHWCGRGNW